MIFGERIRFRGVERDDLPAINKWINDPEVRQGIGNYLPSSMVDEEDWFEEMRKHPADEHNLAIEVRIPGERVGLPDVKPGEPAMEGDEEHWKLIGSCKFFNLDQHNRSSEFGIMIGDKSYWKREYGTEAVRLMVKHGFHTLNLHRIFLRVLETNPRAIRAYEKAGFIHEGRQRQAEFRDGKYFDMLVMSMLNDEF
jgi:RimJ/RimL family protein N-acetyltransferase